LSGVARAWWVGAGGEAVGGLTGGGRVGREVGLGGLGRWEEREPFPAFGLPSF
jgi:hypothetical protein